MIVVDLFAGAGGFSIGAHAHADVTDVLGLELDDDAVATHRAAGMQCAQVDLSSMTEERARDLMRDTFGPGWQAGHLHLHASPPCQSFSNAGKGHGRKHLDTLAVAVRDILADGEIGDDVDLSDMDANTRLVLVPAYWITWFSPETISFEQVRGVLPLWEVYADVLENLHGYETWAGLLHSEQYGVPQTRTRAWLIASFDHEVSAPTPTHSRYHNRKPDRLDEGVLPWVSMAEALGWERDAEVGFPRKNDLDDGHEYRQRDMRPTERPAFGMTEKARSWIMQGGVSGEGKPRPTDEPAPTIGGKATASITDDPELHYGRDRRKANDAGEDWSHYRASAQKRATTRPVQEPAPTVAFGNDMAQARFSNDPEDWGYGRPSTTVCADSRLSGPGARDWSPGSKESQFSGKGARRITVAEAAVLQGFPADHPFQGSKTSQFRQVGNAVNPQVARRILEEATDG